MLCIFVVTIVVATLQHLKFDVAIIVVACVVAVAAVGFLQLYITSLQAPKKLECFSMKQPNLMCFNNAKVKPISGATI